VFAFIHAYIFITIVPVVYIPFINMGLYMFEKYLTNENVSERMFVV